MNGSEHASARKKRDYMCFLGTLIAMTHLSVDRFPSISRICVIDTGYVFQMTFYFLFAASVLQLPHALRFPPCIRDHVRAIEMRSRQCCTKHISFRKPIYHGYIYFTCGTRIFDAQTDTCF